MLDENSRTFIIHVAVFEIPATIQLSWAAQIAALQWDKARIDISAEYANYANVFSFDLVIELTENTGINKQAIEPVVGKQSHYKSIHAPSPMKLEALKTYIKTHFKTGFI